MKFYRRKNSKHTLLASATIIVSVILASCGGATDSSGNTKEITLVYSVDPPEVSAAGEVTVPITQGFFEEEGLDVTVEAVDGSVLAMQLTDRGQYDIGFGGAIGVYSLINAGADLKMLSSLYDENFYLPAVPEDSEIYTPEDLKGKTVGILSESSTESYWLDVVLGEAGMDRDDLESVVSVGAGASAAEALVEGKIDLIWTWEDNYTRLAQQIPEFNIRVIDDWDPLPQLTFQSGYYANTDFIEDDPETVEKLLRATAKGEIFAAENPEQAVADHYDLYPASRPKNEDEQTSMKNGAEILKIRQKALATEKAKNGEWGYPDEGSITAVGDALVQAGAIDDVAPVSTYFTDKFLKAANDFDVEDILNRSSKTD